MKIHYRTSNAETVDALEEVRRMKDDPTIGKTYNNVNEMMRDILDL